LTFGRNDRNCQVAHLSHNRRKRLWQAGVLQPTKPKVTGSNPVGRVSAPLRSTPVFGSSKRKPRETDVPLESLDSVAFRSIPRFGSGSWLHLGYIFGPLPQEIRLPSLSRLRTLLRTRLGTSRPQPLLAENRQPVPFAHLTTPTHDGATVVRCTPGTKQEK